MLIFDDSKTAQCPRCSFGHSDKYSCEMAAKIREADKREAAEIDRMGSLAEARKKAAARARLRAALRAMRLQDGGRGIDEEDERGPR